MEINQGDLCNKKPARGLQNWLRNRSLSQNLKMQAAEDVEMGWNKWEDVWSQPNKSKFTPILLIQRKKQRASLEV